MSDYIVREYAFISVAYDGHPEPCLEHVYIPEKAFNYLCELSASFSKQGSKVFELAGRRKLKLDQYVGVIETPCGTRLEILPKHLDFNGTNDDEIILKERKLLQKMLSVSLHLPYREAGNANLNRFQQPLHEWIISQFLNAFEHLIQKGLRFDYNRVQEEQKFLRGQLQHVKYMRQLPTKRHIFPIEHDVYDINRPENRLIRTALEVVCKKTKDAKNWKLAQELRLMTNQIPKSHNIQQDFRQWQGGRLLVLYEQIKPWTELILGEYMPVATSGQWRGMSLLFPMEKLFEHYVAYHLRCNYPEYKISTQHATEHICEHRSTKMFKLKPDIFVEIPNAKNIVMDTKWKLLDQNDRIGRYGLKDSDIQQMFAYSHYYLKHQSEVILVYPYRVDKFNQSLDEFVFRDTIGAVLRVVPFNLDIPAAFDMLKEISV